MTEHLLISPNFNENKQGRSAPNRKFPYARFLLTRFCPFDCGYCHNEGMGKQSKGSDMFEVDDYLYTATVLKVYFGLRSVTLSGGDPFVYSQLPELARGLRRLNLQVVALTKGMTLKRRLEKGHFRGDEFDFVYFSFDTLDPKKFAEIGRVPITALEDGIAALDNMVSLGVQVKVNCVVLPEALHDPSYLMNMINFAQSHNVYAVKFVEVLDVSHHGEPYLEIALQKAGIKVPKIDRERIVRKYELSHEGQRIEVSRCMCAVTAYTGHLACTDQDLYIDPQGRINPCLEWEVDKNPYATSILAAVKNRDTQALIRGIDSVLIGKIPCPVFMTPEERKRKGAGLNLGAYHHRGTIQSPNNGLQPTLLRCAPQRG